ncbi:phage major capsid protein [Bacillus sp. JJ689]|uniref:phage major capsid family protein n=1 Tax=Bacillus sp. JJ689 TaxID=3122949 RepID=UPI0030007F95
MTVQTLYKPTSPNDVLVTINFVKNSKNIPTIASKFDIFVADYSVKKPIIIDTAEAVAVGPDENGKYKDFDEDMLLDHVVFDQKDISTSINVTGLVENNSPFNLVDEAKERLPYRFYRKAQSEVFGKGNADGDNGLFQSIPDYNDAKKKVAGLKIATFSDVTEMFSDYAKTNGSLNGAILVVDTLAKAIALGPDVFKGMQGVEGISGTAHGVPVMVENMNGKADMILMNPLAYGMSVDRETIEAFEINKAQDTEIGKKDFKFIYSEVSADGKVLNPLGIKIYKAGA